MSKQNNRQEDPRFAPLNRVTESLIAVLGITQEFQEAAEVERARADAEEERANTMRELARVDPLTGLPNRRALQETYARLQADRLRRVIDDPDHTEEPMRSCLLLIDVDDFKAINDGNKSHVEGDRILKKVAGVMLERTRPLDLVARLAGDEFAVLVHDVTPEEAVIIADDMRHVTEARGDVTLSVGVTPVDFNLGFEGNVEKADLALYDVKENGRNRVALFDPAIHQV